MGSIIGSGMSAVASTMNTNATNETNLQIARETNEANESLAREQNDWNLARRNEEWAYNDPSNQMARLKNAGLSAAAAAQAVGPSSAQPMQSADLANQQIGNPMQTADFSGLSGMNIIGDARQLIELSKVKSEADLMKTEAQKAQETLPAQISQVFTESDAKQWALNTVIQNYQQSAKEFPYKLESIKNASIGSQYIPMLQKYAAGEAKKKYELAKQELGFLDKFNPEKLKEIGVRINQIIADTKKSEQETNESEAREGHTRAVTSLVNLEAIGKKIDNALQEFGFPQDPAQKFGALIASGVLPAEKLDEFFNSSKYYLNSGGKYFKGSPELRQYFNQFINPSLAEQDKTPLWSHGSLLQPLRFFDTKLQQIFGNGELSNPFIK